MRRFTSVSIYSANSEETSVAVSAAVTASTSSGRATLFWRHSNAVWMSHTAVLLQQVYPGEPGHLLVGDSIAANPNAATEGYSSHGVCSQLHPSYSSVLTRPALFRWTGWYLRVPLRVAGVSKASCTSTQTLSFRTTRPKAGPERTRGSPCIIIRQRCSSTSRVVHMHL